MRSLNSKGYLSVLRRGSPLHSCLTRDPLSDQALQQNNMEGARIYAANAIRKKTESLNLLRLSSRCAPFLSQFAAAANTWTRALTLNAFRIDAVSSRVETAVTMRQVTGSMAGVVKNMDKAMESMNLEMVCFLARISFVCGWSSDTNV
jgi:division protein CdvB (Snf7/Vps24/ESCRT-III family)